MLPARRQQIEGAIVALERQLTQHGRIEEPIGQVRGLYGRVDDAVQQGLTVTGSPGRVLRRDNSLSGRKRLNVLPLREQDADGFGPRVSPRLREQQRDGRAHCPF